MSKQGVKIDLSKAPKDRLDRAIGYLVAAIIKQPKSDFSTTLQKEIKK